MTKRRKKYVRKMRRSKSTFGLTFKKIHCIIAVILGAIFCIPFILDAMSSHRVSTWTMVFDIVTLIIGGTLFMIGLVSLMLSDSPAPLDPHFNMKNDISRIRFAEERRMMDDLLKK